jgi:hypothetical protein
VKRRGSVLVGVLLILLVLLVGGLALSTRQKERYKGAVAESLSLQALCLAESGWEDARVKLDKDPLFPPPGGLEQPTFTYTEQVNDPDGNRVGSYTVTVDKRFDRAPYYLFVVTSVGSVGPAGANRSTRTVIAEVDSRNRALKALRY